MDRRLINSQCYLRSCLASRDRTLMRGPAPTISSSASVDLTLYRSRSESLLGFHSYVEPSHNEVLACCSWLMLLYIEAVDRYANRRGFLPLLLQCRGK